MMEDFGYEKDSEKQKLQLVIKKIALSVATLLSISCFIYITISAYYYVYGEENNNIETIKSPQDPIKIIEENQIAIAGENPKINDSIYEDIFSSKKESLVKAAPKIHNSLQPALPPKDFNNNDKTLNENVSDFNNSLAKNSPKKVDKKAKQPIIVFSDKPRENFASQDILSAKKVEIKNPPKTLSNQNLDQEKTLKRKYIKIQIAALTSKKSAEEYWQKTSNKNSDLFSGLKPFIQEIDLGKRGIFYRLQIGNFSDQITAEDFCKKYITQTQKNKADCIIVE
ncbi:MAG: SPOR domain-containing protein [Rickettsiales bacterium]|nr:SPOR domain-containing protein [Rickettsiales bacterium]